jgi:hypothetical protein
MDSTNDILERPPYLPPQEEVAAASPDARAILYAEALARAEARGEPADPGRIRAAVGVPDHHIKHAPRLLKEAPEFAAQVKAGRAQLPKRGADWYYFWKRLEAKKAPAAAPSVEAEPAAETEQQTSPIGDVSEKVFEPEPADLTANSGETSPIGEVSALAGVEVVVLKEVSDSEPAEQDRPRFEELKQIVHGGLATFFEVGAALVEIRARKLYRLAGFTVFDDFLRSEFNLSRAYGYRLMDAVASVEDLSAIPGVPAPTNAEQVRPLAGLSSEEKKEIWVDASATAPQGQPPTGAAVKKVREARRKTKSAASKTKSAPPTVPGQNAGTVSLETQVDLAADELSRVQAGWKRGSLSPLQRTAAALGNERLGGALKRFEKDFGGLVERLRSYRALAS